MRETKQQGKTMKRCTLIRCGLAALAFATVLLGAAQTAQAKKHNIVVIMTDDVGV
jgi:spermidine/putrescine-binding protein